MSSAPDTRAKVLAAALDVFAEVTVAGARVPAIAERAGVAAGTLYRYWPSKEALANAVYREAKETFAGYLRRGVDGRMPATRRQLREVFEDLWQNMAAFARAHTAALAFLEHQQHAAYLDEDNQALTRQVKELSIGLIEAGQELGVFRKTDPALLTGMVFGAYAGLSKSGQRYGPNPFDEARDVVWGLLSLPDSSADASGETQ